MWPAVVKVMNSSHRAPHDNFSRQQLFTLDWGQQIVDGISNLSEAYFILNRADVS